MFHLLFFVIFPERKELKMEKTGLQGNRVRILLTVLTAAVMVLIFCFSMEPAEQSDETSGRLTRQVISMLYPEYDHYPETQRTELYDNIQTVVRKAAHFAEFALLGFLLRLCLESWFGKRRWLGVAGWAAGTVYAGTDEIHQIQVAGRTAQWTDVLLDSAGVLTGVLLAVLAVYLIRNRYSRKEAEKACP